MHMQLVTTGSAILIQPDGTLIVELVAFVLVVLAFSRWVYPILARVAEARQERIAEQLEAAKRDREEAQHQLEAAREEFAKARAQASDIIGGANRGADQVRAEGREKAEEEAKRIVDNARREIESERQRAVQSVRQEVADLVVGATEKVVGRALDGDAHRRLIDEAIEQVGAARGNGAEHHG
jgi:F-type H+-transporting ATPase subunit b